MSAPPFMPFYPDDYLGATRHLSRAQHGSYLLLIMHYWVKGSLPDDEAVLARIAGMTTREWRRERDVIAAFFEPGWRHTRIENDRLRAEKKSISRAVSGSLGGQAKSLNNKGQGLANASDLLQQSGKQNASETLASSTEPIKEEEHPSDARQTDGWSSAGKALSPARQNSPVRLAPTDDFDTMVADFNRVAARVGWPRVQKATPARRAAGKRRLAEDGGLAGWRAGLERAAASAFLCGQGGRESFSVTFDWLVKPANFTKLMEGNYDNRPDGRAGAARPAAGSAGPSALLAAVAGELRSSPASRFYEPGDSCGAGADGRAEGDASGQAGRGAAPSGAGDDGRGGGGFHGMPRLVSAAGR